VFRVKCICGFKRTVESIEEARAHIRKHDKLGHFYHGVTVLQIDGNQVRAIEKTKRTWQTILVDGLKRLNELASQK
jgi:hypothetical protein